LVEVLYNHQEGFAPLISITFNHNRGTFQGEIMRTFLLGLFFSSSVMAASIYGIKEKTIEGQDFSTDSLKGKVVLIVNIASQCGYTPQLSGLEALYQKYKAKNFVLLGVPTNDFGGQTPEDDKGMKEFCSKKYNVTFPLLNKRTVQGKEKRPLYQVLAASDEIGWNFEKFLVNKKGEVIERFKSGVSPDDKDLQTKIEAQL
jgi:glutathione peroxidase